MIEEMITEIQPFLPLKILEANWDETTFQIYGSNWSFNTLSAWRISVNNKIIMGCFDPQAIKFVNLLRGIEITQVSIQNQTIKVDPVFILSDNKKIEIFSTDTFEPWTFHIKEFGFWDGNQI